MKISLLVSENLFVTSLGKETLRRRHQEKKMSIQIGTANENIIIHNLKSKVAKYNQGEGEEVRKNLIYKCELWKLPCCGEEEMATEAGRGESRKIKVHPPIGVKEFTL